VATGETTVSVRQEGDPRASAAIMRRDPTPSRDQHRIQVPLPYAITFRKAFPEER
jgi:hypothetical protein